MSRLLLLIFAVLVVVVLAVSLLLGAFPPSPQAQQVQRVLPNDRFAPSR